MARLGYQLESIAVEAIVRMVEEYIAAHAELFRADNECRAGLSEILNVLVDAGWPATQLLDTGVFDRGWWEVTVDVAKADPEDPCVAVRVRNAGPAARGHTK